MLPVQALAFLAGLAALFATSIALLPPAQLHPFAGGATLPLMVVGILMFAAGYFFFAVAGYRIVRSAWRRRLAVLVVLFQLLAGGAMIWRYPQPAVLGVMLSLLCVSVFMFTSFVWPARRDPGYRPARWRERPDGARPPK
jgi:divalent metal cation (Fe/Co/Zn/Cd) transporter